ncbi:MAG: hypothetical protein ACKVOA_10555 [Methylophilaceae bacterium]
MKKIVKKYLLLCLICLQIVAPFIHAHAFGHDSFKEHIIHFHTDEVGNQNSVDNAFSQTHVGENQMVGAITTVAKGIKTVLADEIALMAILFSFVLILFNFKKLFLPPLFQTANYQRIAYSLLPSRAPPR